ncbi:DeoR family transcriptional regulator [Ferroacidibacillus organovorans]|uniref:DeoR family transcriptional regulator n=2 Tax=Ferroacidibacillus organovorans TaxID=1765683 RepID=A0A101XS36_9BACL|nr:DeoR family transcriptional regulator [Ferroacidibacillus organovorans]
MSYLNQHQRVTLQTICELYDVSRDTARRDVVKLAQTTQVVRTRGGLMLPGLSKEVYGYKERLHRESSGKLEIGRTAAALVSDGEFLILDASTTVQFAAESLTARNVTVVTNAIDAASILSEKENVTVHVLGGKLNQQHRFLYGASTLEKLAEYHVDKLFLGACGITEDGLSYPHEEDGVVKRAMIRHADQVVVLADHTKFGKRLFHKISDLDAMDILITDREPSVELQRALDEAGVEVMVVEGGRS